MAEEDEEGGKGFEDVDLDNESLDEESLDDYNSENEEERSNSHFGSLNEIADNLESCSDNQEDEDDVEIITLL